MGWANVLLAFGSAVATAAPAPASPMATRQLKYANAHAPVGEFSDTSRLTVFYAGKNLTLR